MADETEPSQSQTFIVGDQEVDAWGREVVEDGKVDYSSWAPKELKDEIDRRNAGRDEDSQIVLEDKKKSTAVAALAADDAANDSEDEEE